MRIEKRVIHVTASSKSSSSLSLGCTIGIEASVACSVLALIFGVSRSKSGSINGQKKGSSATDPAAGLVLILTKEKFSRCM